MSRNASLQLHAKTLLSARSTASEFQGSEKPGFPSDKLAPSGLPPEHHGHLQLASLGSGTQACQQPRPVSSGRWPSCLGLAGPLRGAGASGGLSREPEATALLPAMLTQKHNPSSSRSCPPRDYFSLWTWGQRQLERASMWLSEEQVPWGEEKPVGL